MDDNGKRLVGPACMMLALLSGCSPEPAADSKPPGVELIELPGGSERMSPNLAVGADGTVLLSWLERGSDGAALRFSRLTDWRWGPAQTIARGEDWFVNWADFPSVVPISRDLWAAHWLVSQPAGGYAYDVFVAVSTDAGASWSQAIRPHRDDTATEHGFVTLYPQDRGVGLIWLDGRNMVYGESDDPVNTGMTLRSASLSADLILSNEQQVDGLICDCCRTDAAVTNAGPVAVYRDRTSDEIRDIRVARHDGERWQEGRRLGGDNWHIAGCPVNGPAIDADGNRAAVAWFTAADDDARVQVALSDDAAESFSTAIEVAGHDALGQAGVALLPGGDVAVSWLRKASSGSAELCMRRVSADGGLGPVLVVSADDDVPRFSSPQLVRKGNDLLLAWTARIDERSQVITARVAMESL